MKYKNISDEKLNIFTIEGNIRVAPGEEFLTAPKYAAPFIEAGKVAIAQPPTPKKEKE
jgi:hypothetical protein